MDKYLIKLGSREKLQALYDGQGSCCAWAYHLRLHHQIYVEERFAVNF